MDKPSYNDPAFNPRQAALECANPDDMALIAALVYIGDMLGGVQETLQTLDVTIHNGLVAIAED